MTLRDRATRAVTAAGAGSALAATAALTAAGGLAVATGHPGSALWQAATAIGLLHSLAVVVPALLRHRFGADVIAVLALLGALLFGEYLAGALIATMFATGQALEGYAGRRARGDLSALLARAPRWASLRTPDGTRQVPVAQLRVGDLIELRPGEVVPVDARLSEAALFDESALTGESVPVGRAVGEIARSGTVNAGAAVSAVVVRTVDDSSYAGMVRMAERAAAETAPAARLADRFATAFLPATLLLAGAAWWWSGDSARAVAVLVTATPCPLVLAVPVAVTAGMSAASRCGVVVKDGAALERLGHARIALLDKTGTLTVGRPTVGEVIVAPGRDRDALLGWAAAVEQSSPHVLATAVVRAARTAGVPVSRAARVTDDPRSGATGDVDGHRVAVGALPDMDDAPHWTRTAEERAAAAGAGIVWVTVDGAPAAAMLVADRLRANAAATLRRLRAAGIHRLVLVTGDRREVAEDVALRLGVDDVVAGATPADKVTRLRTEQAGGLTMVVGDGINDAPALAAADVGVALGARGTTAAAQAADAVVTDDRIDRIADVASVARRTRRLAVQSAGTGVGLSVLAMVAAAIGVLGPAPGALVQELIDVAVVANALRALATRLPDRLPARARQVMSRFAAEHPELVTARDAVRTAAESLSEGLTPASVAAVRRANDALVGELLPHERAEETQLYPEIAKVMGGPESMLAMSHEHTEIERAARRLARYVEQAEPWPPGRLEDLRALLYGLDAVLTLHFGQEEQDYFALAASEQNDMPSAGIW